MEALERKYNNFHKAYTALRKAIDLRDQLLKTIPNGDDLFSSGVIQHFEITYETAWKFLKQYLQDLHTLEIGSPKGIFRECYKIQLFSESFVNDLNKLADARNNTSHIYDQETAQEVTADIIKHYTTLGEILKKLHPPFGKI